MTSRPVQRIAIINRGEPAVRFLRALREYNLEHDTNLTAVAFYTDPDASAPFVRLADETVRLGAAMRSDGNGGMVSAYVHIDSLIEHLHASQCDAVWPGWGFVSEDARFVERLEAEGITFIGPSSAAIDALGDKIASKQLARDAGVPMAPWAELDADADEATIRAAGDRVGYPLMVKASAGGGGRGIRRVDDASGLVAAVHGVADEVRRVFGQGGLFVEQCVVNARHIEVQFVVGVDGRGRALGVRDCSLQRRNQKVIEEAPSPVLPPLTERELCAAAVRLAETARYRGVGTAEFLFVPETRQASFLEVNSRLQVEHTVTELLTGCDLVKTQLDIARGVAWDPGFGEPRGWAIEARLNAEDPEAGFRPAPGHVRVFRPPSGPGIRVDSGVIEGSTIAPEFDSMIAKVIAWGPTRDEAIARLERALIEFDIVVEDGATNRAFLLDLLRRPEFRDATAHTRWLDEASAAGAFDGAAGAFEALLVAGVVASRTEEHAERQRFQGEVHSGIPQRLPAPEGQTLQLKLRGTRASIVVHDIGRDRYLAGTPGRLHRIRLEPLGANAALLHIGDQRHRVLYARGRSGVHVDIDGALHHVERATGGLVRAPAPALVSHIELEEGQHVRPGDLLCMLEAMKMETPLFAEEEGVVQSVLARANMQVAAGQPIVVLRPVGDGNDTSEGFVAPAPPRSPAAALRIDGRFDATAIDRLDDEAAAAAVAELAARVRTVLMGYDAPTESAEALADLLDDEHAFASIERPERWAPLLAELEVFADVESLFDRNLLPLPDEAAAVSAEVAFYDFCRRHHLGADGTGPTFRPLLERALRWYGVHTLAPSDSMRRVLWRLAVAHRHATMRHRLCSGLLRVAIALGEAGLATDRMPTSRDVIDRVSLVANAKYVFVADNARQAAYTLFDRQRFHQGQRELHASIAEIAGGAPVPMAVAEAAHDVLPEALRRLNDPATTASGQASLVELIVRRVYDGRIDDASMAIESSRSHGRFTLVDGERVAVVWGDAHAADVPASEADRVERILPDGWLAADVDAAASAPGVPGDRVETWTWRDGDGAVHHRTRGGYDDAVLAHLHPEIARRVEAWRLDAFAVTGVSGSERVCALALRAHDNDRDERVHVVAEVFDVPATLAPGGDRDLWEFERAFFEGLRLLRESQAPRNQRRRLHQNRLTLVIRRPIHASARDIARLAWAFAAPTRGLGLERVVIRVPVLDEDGAVTPTDFRIHRPGRHRLEVHPEPIDRDDVRSMTRYDQRVVRARQLGTVYPYEIVRMLEGRAADSVPPHPDMGDGTFVEYDLVDGAFVAVDRPRGQNTCGVVAGLVRNATRKHPEGIERVFLASDATMAMGALAEPECRRVIAALELAESRGIPVEWIPVSAGARIAMDSGTENLDWTAAVLRRIIEFTQQGGIIHVIVDGVNVGAQSYWNAEATMLMHTRGALIMTPAGSMVLTGRKALEYSGGVAAEDEKGIGGFERIMGPNGQAQYFANDLGEAYAILFEHYRFTWSGTGSPARLHSADPRDRSILDSPYTSTTDDGFATVGEIFDDATNPGRRRPFAIRAVMKAVADTDGGVLERYRTSRDAETAVVQDAHIGGHPVCLLGIESRPLPRRGRVPLDGPDTWTGGTLFPRSSRKIARAINAASGNRPVVVLANLSGFDGSPESLRKWQLEFGAEIGRAVVNFDGPIVFVVIGRYHGGAYVVFSKALNPQLTALALEGAYASVIGGAPAAAVVFPRLVRKRVAVDPRVVESAAALAAATDAERPRRRERHESLVADVTLEVQGEVAAEFDAIHTVQRAVEVGSLDAVIAPRDLRPAIIDRLDAALARGAAAE